MSAKKTFPNPYFKSSAGSYCVICNETEVSIYINIFPLSVAWIPESLSPHKISGAERKEKEKLNSLFMIKLKSPALDRSFYASPINATENAISEWRTLMIYRVCITTAQCRKASPFPLSLREISAACHNICM